MESRQAVACYRADNEWPGRPSPGVHPALAFVTGRWRNAGTPLPDHASSRPAPRVTGSRGVTMRQLWPFPCDPVDPAALYAELPRAATRPAVRLNMIASIDGATAISSEPPARRIGMWLSTMRRLTGSSIQDRLIGVTVAPGPMLLTRMPRAAYSKASDRVRFCMPPLDTE